MFQAQGRGCSSWTASAQPRDSFTAREADVDRWRWGDHGRCTTARSGPVMPPLPWPSRYSGRADVLLELLPWPSKPYAMP
jgi:hypothetical protein